MAAEVTDFRPIRIAGQCSNPANPRQTGSIMLGSMEINRDLRTYYARRAPEYERVYDKPERQAEMVVLRENVATLLAGRRVLEIACGTGYWTSVIAPSARYVMATDAVEEVLAIARTKTLPPGRVEFRIADAFALASIPPNSENPTPFDAGLAAFWWSHIEKRRIAEFLAALHGRLAPDARVVLVENRFVKSSSTPVSRIDRDGNTYQLRKLADGTTHEVLKNFPSEAELCSTLAPFANMVCYEKLEYYWLVSYQVKAD